MKILFLLLLLAAAVFAQTPADPVDKNAVFLGATYTRRNVELERPTGETFQQDKLNDSIGAEFSYTHFPKNGPLGLGFEAGASFHDVDNSTVALAYFNYAMTLQARKKAVQPYVKFTAGVARDDFGGMGVRSGPSGELVLVHDESTFTLGGGAGLDFRVSRRARWRVGLDYLNTGFGDSRQHNAKLVTGLVFVF